MAAIAKVARVPRKSVMALSGVLFPFHRYPASALTPLHALSLDNTGPGIMQRIFSAAARPETADEGA